MSSPFPGIDPYLEHPELWSEVHHRLITAIADAIAPPIRPKYRVAIEKQTYLSDVEDSVLIAFPKLVRYNKPDFSRHLFNWSLDAYRYPTRRSPPRHEPSI